MTETTSGSTDNGPGRRSLLIGASAGLVLAGAGTASAASAASATTTVPSTQSRSAGRRPMPDTTAVLVHGAFADGSSWSPVVARLQEKGVAVVVVQLSLSTLADDVAVLSHRLSRIPGRKVVAAHSYGGVPVSEADFSGLDVAGLVFAAAYTPDAGESLLSLNATAPPLPAADPANTLVDLEAQQLIMSPTAFTRYFCPDLPKARREVLAAVQRPIGFGAGGTPASRASWRTLPTWYQLSLDDQIVSPVLQRRLSDRIPTLRRRLELRSSHASIQSHPDEVAGLVIEAVHATA